MIYYQIEDVETMFKDLQELEANAWVPKVKEAPIIKEVSKRLLNNNNKVSKIKKSPRKGGSLKEMMAAKRREMKQQQKENAGGDSAKAGTSTELQVSRAGIGISHSCI